MEIGGDSYTKAKPALQLVLSNPNVKCLLVNFCGAFARTDVMADGVVKAWQKLKPTIRTKYLYRQNSPTIVKRRFIEQYFFTKLFEVYEINDALPTAEESESFVESLRDWPRI